MKIFKKYGFRTLCIVLMLTITCTLLVALTTAVHREIPRTTEKEVYIKLESLFGKVYFSRGNSDNILTADVRFDGEEHAKTNIQYNIRENIGYLTLELNKGSKSGDDSRNNIDFGDVESGKWYIKSSDAIPLTITSEMGLGKGEYDFTGLQVKGVKLSAGASSVLLKCDEPNKQVIEDLRLESGVGKLEADNLCNLNFQRMKFSGGVGGYELDFGGKLKHDAEVNVEIGLGSIKLYIPDYIGAKIIYKDSWVSKISLDPEFIEHEEHVYTTENYGQTGGRLTIQVEAGLGSVKVIRGTRL